MQSLKIILRSGLAQCRK